MRTFKILASLGITVVAGSLAACSGDKTDNIFVVIDDAGTGVLLADGAVASPTAATGSVPLPIGSVSGIIYDGSSEKGLAGVAVNVTVNGKTYNSTSDMNGLYTIGGVPATTVWVQYSLAGYADAFFATAPSTTTVSNFGTVTNPITQVNPVGLVKTTGTFTLRVLTESGAPASGVVARARQSFRYLSYGSGQPISGTGAWDVTATSAADGSLNFANLLDLSTINSAGVQPTLNIDIAPTTVGAGNTSYSFLGVNGLSFNLLQLTGSAQSLGGVPYFVLAGPSTTLSALQSNVDFISSAGGVSAAVSPVAAAGPITVGFNQAINPSTVHTSLFNEDGTPSPITLAPTVSVNELSLAPSAPFAAGVRYNLALSVDATYRIGNTNASTRSYQVMAPFFTQAQAQTVSIVSVTNDPAFLNGAPSGHVIVQFSEPVGFGRGVANSITCAAFYEAQLNSTAAVGYGGEWPPAGQSWPLQCFNTGTISNSGGVSYTNGSNTGNFDPTSLGNLENNGTYVTNASRFVRTGYNSKWSLQYGTAATGSSACATGVAAPPCVPPATGTKTHLVFSLASAGLTVTRATGEPVPDGLSFSLP